MKGLISRYSGTLIVIIFVLSAPNVPLRALREGLNAFTEPFIPFEGSILLDSEDDFNETNGVVSGSGTKADPYVIEGWSFDASAGTSIKVLGTSSYLTIRNVWISGGTGSGRYGIIVNDADNVIVASSIINWTGGGVRLQGPCKNVAIEYNRIENTSGCGIDISGKFEGLRISNNTLAFNGADGLLATDPKGTNILVGNNTVINNLKNGIHVVRGDLIDIFGNRVVGRGEIGIYLLSSTGSGVKVRSNTVSDQDRAGIEAQSVVGIGISENSVFDCPENAILVWSYTSYCTISNNTLMENPGNGIRLQCIGAGNVIVGNVLHGCGITSSGATISSNKVYDSTKGITTGDGSKVSGNVVDNAQYGIMGGSGSTIEKNTISKASVSSIYILGGENLKISSNNITSGGTMIFINMSSKVDIFSNLLFLDYPQVMVQNSDNVTIWNNGFKNSRKCTVVDSRDVRWSLPEKKPGDNIAGGQYLHGNYWPDYTGEDIDGDGIGDTNLPFGPGDNGPLVRDPPPPDTEPPYIIKGGSWVQPETNEESWFRFIVKDNRSLFGVKVSMGWTLKDKDGRPLTKGPDKAFKFYSKGQFEFSIEMPLDAATITFHAVSTDFSGNRNEQNISVPVRDTIKPSIFNVSYLPKGIIDEDFTISLEATDNIGLQRIYASYYFDKGSSDAADRNATLVDGACQYEVSIPMRPCTELHFILRAMDMSSSVYETDWVMVPIVDKILPFAVDISQGSPMTEHRYNLTFEITDNIAIVGATLKLRYNGIGGNTFECSGLRESIWTVPVDVGESVEELGYELIVVDWSGNKFTIMRTLSVLDATPPKITHEWRPGPLTGYDYELSFHCEDNRELGTGAIEWWIDDGPHKVVDGIPGNATVPIIDPDASILHIMASVTDRAGNEGRFYENLSVRDGIPPSVFLVYDEPLTSHLWNVTVIALDRSGVEGISIECSIDGGDTKNAGASISIKIPENAIKVSITTRAKDLSGLTTNITRNIPIGDGTPPRITSHWAKNEGDGKTGFSVEGTDNRAAGLSAFLILEGMETIKMEEIGNGSFYLEIRDGKLEKVNKYRFKVTDGAGLSTFSENETLKMNEGFPLTIVWIGLSVLAVIGAISIIVSVRRRKALRFKDNEI